MVQRRGPAKARPKQRKMPQPSRGRNIKMAPIKKRTVRLPAVKKRR